MMLAALSGAGKSMLVGSFSELSEGVSRPSAWTASTNGRSTCRSNTRSGMKNKVTMVVIKGTPVTFDLEKLTESI